MQTSGFQLLWNHLSGFNYILLDIQGKLPKSLKGLANYESDDGRPQPDRGRSNLKEGKFWVVKRNENVPDPDKETDSDASDAEADDHVPDREPSEEGHASGSNKRKKAPASAPTQKDPKKMKTMGGNCSHSRAGEGGQGSCI